MKKFLTILIVLVTTECSSQIVWREWIDTVNVIRFDSVKLKVIKVGTMEKRSVYWFAVDKKDTSTILLTTGERVLLRKQRPVAICECKHKRGEIITVAKKDLEIIKDSFTKKDLEK